MLESLANAGPNSSGGLLSLIRRRFSEGRVASAVTEASFDEGMELIPAAVLVRDHAGQVSFPGGRCEEGDASPEATALREAEEEVGINAYQVEILGRLPEYRTGTGFIVTPVVGLVTPPLNLRLDDFEVAEVFEPPLEFLLDRNNHQRQSIEVRGVRREYWAMPWQGYFIWGATAGMLVTLQHFLYPET
jgi:8-oxo-dGTP pyrophosphatase MutT (NUDIX family)